MEIDFSEKPEGATHYKKDGAYAGEFFRYENGEVQSFWTRKNRWDQTDRVSIDELTQISSGVDGIGLPPIGTECEAFNDHLEEWILVRVIDHQGSTQSAVCREIGTDKLWWSDSFRPVKTEDEIAKEEKQNWCRDTLLECGHLHPSLELSLLAQSMYDKGYRKQVTP